MKPIRNFRTIAVMVIADALCRGGRQSVETLHFRNDGSAPGSKISHSASDSLSIHRNFKICCPTTHALNDGIVQNLAHCSTACCPIDETMTLPAVCETLNRFIHFEHEQIDSANHFYRTVSITILNPQ